MASASPSHHSHGATHSALGVSYLGTLAVAAIWMIGWHAFVPDDVYFYLKIADSLYRGHGSTFNGLVFTNGYHPLWMGVAWLGRALAGSDARAVIRVHFAFSVLGNLISIWLMHRLARKLGMRADIAPALIAIYTAYNFVGSEQHVSMPLLLVSLLMVTQLTAAEAASNRALFGTGLVLGLTVLARLDNVFAVSALALVAAHGGKLSKTLRRALPLAAGMLLCVLPYLLWNVSRFGHLEPISGVIKSALAAQLGYNPAKLGRQGQVLTLVAWLAPVVGLSLWRARLQLATNAFMVGVAVHALYVVLKLEAVWTWYFAGELIALALVVERARARFELRVFSWLVPAAIALSMFGVVQAKRAALAAANNPFYLAAGSYIDAHVREHEGVAICCSPGAIGFFSHRPIFALDGLTGDFAFHQRARELGLYAALQAIGVRYLLSDGPRSTELPPLIRATQARGHGGESVSFAGPIDADGSARSEAVGLYSPLLQRQVGWLRTGVDNLVGERFCGRDMGLWRLEPAAR